MVMIVVMAMVVGTEKNRESRVVVVGAAVAMTFSSFLRFSLLFHFRYAFPRITNMPEGAIKEAKDQGTSPDQVKTVELSSMGENGG